MKAARRAALAAAALLLVPGGTACRRAAPPPDPAREMLRAVLAPGDRLLALHVLDPDTADRIAAVVVPEGARPELRVYERREAGAGRGPGPEWAVAHRAPQGEVFRNLAIEDVTGDGRPEILATSAGGHLEVIEVLARGDDGVWRMVFQNGGREIERRYGRGGSIEFHIRSRTYEEQAGQAPAYDTAIYRWDGRVFREAAGR